MTQQYLRQVNLIVSQGGKGIDLSQMHIQFQVFAPDTDAPPSAYIRIWNLSQDTANRIQKEFDHVSLQAGYSDPGIIFDGTITQVKKGAENAIDKYVDIMASDLDEFYNYTLVSKTLAKGSSQKDQLNAVIEAGKASGATSGSIDLGTGGTLPRGKVLFGMSREYMTSITKSTDTSWFIANGKINVVKKDGYLPGDVVVLNSDTGMLGVPESTNNGIEIKCNLNPKIKVGSRVKIDNADINSNVVKQRTPTNVNEFPANVSADGIYRVLVVEHFGDNRGNQFESHLTCLSFDSTVKV